ncbi:MAG: hypothetical protein KGZ58_12280 [Ignavibacteriales bacterium]|nr:hypothetical protein [Ignavibacteriales bacterium]
MTKKKSAVAKIPEYRFLVSKFIDERTQKEKILFTLETTRVFRSFRYNILVKEKSAPAAFVFVIDGLTMSSLSIPETGPAFFLKEVFMLKGEYDFTVINLNKDKAHFKLKFTPKNIKIVKAPENSFIELFLE